jgi:hypothetical protein
MGGFNLDYVAGSEQTLGAFVADDGNIESDFYVIDDAHLLCLLWRPFNSSGESWALVIDHSDPVTVTFGALATFVMPGTYGETRPVPTRLTDTDWVLWDWSGGCQRFTVVGDVVTPGAGWDPVTGWNHSLWEGHSNVFPEEGLTINVVLIGSHFERLGLDINHVLVCGGLNWFSGSRPFFYPRWYVLDLTTDGIQPVTEFVPDDGVFPFFLGAEQVDIGVGYWWVYETYPDNETAPSGLKLALVEATASSISVVEVTGYDFSAIDALAMPGSVPPGRNFDDDTWWFACVANTELHPYWDPADPWCYTTTMVKVDGVTASTHDYTGEYDWTNRPPLLTQPWWFGSGKMAADDCLLTWQVNDSHLRAEVGRSNNYTTDAPHGGRHKAGLSHGRFVDIETTAYSHASGTLYGSVYREAGLPPEVDFSVDDDLVNVGDPVTFDAENLHRRPRQPPADSETPTGTPLTSTAGSGTTARPTRSPSSNPTVHTYRRSSATHSAGSQTADATIRFTSLIGDIGYYLPVLRAHNSVGWSYASGTWEIEVDGPDIAPPQRQFPRTTGSELHPTFAGRQPTSKQYGQRRGRQRPTCERVATDARSFRPHSRNVTATDAPGDA